MMLHPNAATRTLRREMVRLNDARLELLGAVNDPRIPAGVAIQQIAQCDREIGELVWAHGLVEAACEAQQAAVGIAAE